ncbi:hypothetical protein V1478_005309 [Vespula squamosa]|uniref:Uncharacterized protein n=1 Tax=Vespula squamosa TaxID=30214 RepID=A0ABD2BDT2_VESSQ
MRNIKKEVFNETRYSLWYYRLQERVWNGVITFMVVRLSRTPRTREVNEPTQKKTIKNFYEAMTNVSIRDY